MPNWGPTSPSAVCPECGVNAVQRWETDQIHHDLILYQRQKVGQALLVMTLVVPALFVVGFLKGLRDDIVYESNVTPNHPAAWTATSVFYLGITAIGAWMLVRRRREYCRSPVYWFFINPISAAAAMFLGGVGVLLIEVALGVYDG